ncbi:MAG: hypothetical protein JW768_00700 [Chitinispirillaceae bacterium]|nr:hypothetical protein [Chitinispirillaceae bacterium]
MKKLLALVSAVGLVALWSGCGLIDPEDPNITVVINNIGDVTVNSGSVSFTVKVESDEEITSMTYQVKQSGTDVTSKFTVTPPSTADYEGKKDVTLDFSIAAGSSAAAGAYDFYVKVVAGDIDDDDTRSFTVEGGGTPITTGTVTIGSYANATLGSSIDLDNGTVMLAAAAKQAGSGVDIVGTYSSDLGAFRIFSPVYASASSGITAFANWNSPNDTKFKKVSVDFASVTTVEQIASLYSSETSAELSSSDAAAGDVFVVDTDEGYALMEITSFESTTSGTASIKYGN